MPSRRELEQEHRDATRAMEQLLRVIERTPANASQRMVAALDDSATQGEARLVAARQALQDFDRRQAIEAQRQEFMPREPGLAFGDGLPLVDGDATAARTQRNRQEGGHMTQTRARVTREPLTYERSNGRSFFRDLYLTRTWGDIAAQQRLQRHVREMEVEQRALSSTDGVGGDFVPPIWVAEEWIPAVRAGRPFANIVNHKPLPSGTDSVNLPKVLTGAATSAQADLGAVQSTDPTTGVVTVPVKTIAGEVTLSRQLLDRSQPGMDEILFADLAADYSMRLDLQTLSGSGAGANAKGLLSDANRIVITYTGATPTVAEVHSKISDANQQIFGQTFRPATHVVLHPRRWAWITAQSDSTGRPFVAPEAGAQAQVGTFGITDQGVVGKLSGLVAVVDPNIPTNLGAGTNEDTIIVTRASEVYLFEDTGGPRVRVDESRASAALSVVLQAWGYFAFSTERLSKASANISGTKLVPPVF